MGKHDEIFRKIRKIPITAWVMIALAVMSLTVGGVVAYLSTSTGAVTNEFTADESTDPVISETFHGDEKSNVVVNVGDPGYAVYVRAAVVVTWKDKDGNVKGTMPVAGTDYKISLNLDTKDSNQDDGNPWFQGDDGFYYHKAMVNSGGETAVLIKSCRPVDGKTPEGYGLNVEIIAQTIQALGTTDEQDLPAVTAAWRIDVKNKELTPDP